MIEIDEIVDHDDGSATFTVTMDYDTLVNFARLGLLNTLKEAAEKVLNEEKDQTL